MREDRIATAIRRLRKSAGMTVDDVGAAVGRTGKAVSAWEAGYSQPSAEMLIDLCRLFGVDISYFYPPEVTAPDALTVDEAELLELYRSLDEMGREMALSAVRGMASSREDTSRVAEGRTA